VAQKILVVDDSPIELKLTTRLLAQAGYETITASGGPQALRLSRDVRPDMVFLDIIMPQMDGYEVCQALKGDPLRSTIPVVLYSVRDQIEDVLRGLEVGAEDFIIKGGPKEEVIERIRRVFSHQEVDESLIPALDWSHLDQGTKSYDGEQTARRLSDGFNREVRPRIYSLLGSRPGRMLIEQAARRALEQRNLLTPLDQDVAEAYPFDMDGVRRSASDEVLEGFKSFAGEILCLLAKMVVAKVLGMREIHEVTQAFEQMMERFVQSARENR